MAEKIIVHCSKHFDRVPDFLKDVIGSYDRLMIGDNVVVLVYDSEKPDKSYVERTADKYGYRILN